jgi:hypothetical protein
MKYPQAVVTRPSGINPVRRRPGIRSGKQEHQAFVERMMEEWIIDQYHDVEEYLEGQWQLNVKRKNLSEMAEEFVGSCRSENAYEEGWAEAVRSWGLKDEKRWWISPAEYMAYYRQAHGHFEGVGPCKDWGCDFCHKRYAGEQCQCYDCQHDRRADECPCLWSS